MADLLDLIALSLLPPWCWLYAADRLRSGLPPRSILNQLLRDHWAGEPDKAASLRTRAETARHDAEALGITPVPWSDPHYPIALTTIPDPPPGGCVLTPLPPWPSES